MTTEPAERSTRDGSIYGQDALNVSEGKLQTMSFNRMYRHAFTNANYQWQAGMPKYTTNSSDAGWHVLPIQNAVQAAMRPRDWVALNNYFCKWRIKGFKIECSNFNAEELRPSAQNAVDSSTIPNLYFECYVDADHLLPGYEQDFLRYSTNNGYSTCDTSAVNDGGDIALRKWHFINTLGETVLPDREIDLPNGPGYKFIKMTDNFDFDWSVDEKERRWRHAGQPWQYQLNEAAILQAKGNANRLLERDTQRDRSFPYQGNLSWGGFPGGRTGPFGYDAAFGGGSGKVPDVEGAVLYKRGPLPPGKITFKTQANPEVDEDWANAIIEADGGGQLDAPCGVQLSKPFLDQAQLEIYDLQTEWKQRNAGVGATAQGDGGPQFGWALENEDESEGTYYQNGGMGMGYQKFKDGGANQIYSYNPWKDQTARSQITGVPQLNTPPPLILFRTNDRGNGANISWQFWCKYSVIIEGHRNTLGYYPLPMASTGTSSWTGCGNLGFTTAPGMGNYNNVYQDEPWVDYPYDYPLSAVDASANIWLSDTTRPLWPTGNTKEDSIYVGSSDEEE